MPLVPITEAARQLGVSTDTIARRIKKKSIFARRDNAGRWLVDIASAATANPAVAVANSAPPHATATAEPEHAQAASPEAFDALEAAIERRHRAEIERLRESHAAALATVQAAYSAFQTLHLDLVGRLQAQAAAERQLFIERVDAAEIRAEWVEARLDQVLDVLLTERRQHVASQDGPWWRRWFGVSKRTKLGGG